MSSPHNDIYKASGGESVPTICSTAFSIIRRGLAIDPPDKPSVQQIKNQSDCVLSGVSLSEGYALAPLIKTSSGIAFDTFAAGVDGFVSADVAACLAGTWNLGSRLFFEDGSAFRPVIAKETAIKENRPCWSDLVRQIYPARKNQLLVMILTDDFKKRLWHKTRAAPLGANTAVYFHNGSYHVSTNLQIDWEKLIETLDVIETIYEAGFNKSAIHNGLFSDFAAFAANPAQTKTMENELKKFRAASEFLPALTIAQKQIKEKKSK